MLFLHISITKQEKLSIILEHLELEIEEKGEYTGIREMRKHICYYLKGEPGASEIREKINHAESRNEVESILREFYK